MKETPEDLVKYLKALLILQLHAGDPESSRKPELLLANAGLSAAEIAPLLFKNEAAVAKAISRSRKS
jgi:hypothetical protein